MKGEYNDKKEAIRALANLMWFAPQDFYEVTEVTEEEA